MTETETDNSGTEETGRWYIDLDWFPQNSRSFAAVARGCLCSGAHKRLGTGAGEIDPEDLMATVRDCCSRNPDFISRQLPVLMAAFRLFLANGNQPLELEELSEQLDEKRGGDTYRCSPEVLTRLLGSDQFYGLRPVPE